MGHGNPKVESAFEKQSRFFSNIFYDSESFNLQIAK